MTMTRSQASAPSLLRRIGSRLEIRMLGLALTVAVGLSIISPYFLTHNNIFNVLDQSVVIGIVAIGIAIPIFITYLQEGIVPRLPTAVLSTGLMLLAFLSIACGLILDTVTRGRREMKLLAYLSQPAVNRD